MNTELNDIRKKILKIVPVSSFVITFEDVLYTLKKKQPNDKEIENFLNNKNADIKDLLFYIISNWEFGKILNEQNEEFITDLNEILK
ncbi:MAG: hypothetical protein WC414_04280 [Patescibacteria group bacterium]